MLTQSCSQPPCKKTGCPSTIKVWPSTVTIIISAHSSMSSRHSAPAQPVAAQCIAPELSRTLPKGVPTGRPVSTLRAASMVMDSQAYLWPYTGSADAVAASHDAQFRNVLPVRATEPTAAEDFAPA